MLRQRLGGNASYLESKLTKHGVGVIVLCCPCFHLDINVEMIALS